MYELAGEYKLAIEACEQAGLWQSALRIMNEKSDVISGSIDNLAVSLSGILTIRK